MIRMIDKYLWNISVEFAGSVIAFEVAMVTGSEVMHIPSNMAGAVQVWKLSFVGVGTS